MAVDTAGNHDWANVPFFHVTDPSNTTADDSWKSGQKQDTSCPVLSLSKNPGKDDFTDVASYSDTASSGGVLGDTFLYGATIRFTANGNASENVELQTGAAGNCLNSNGTAMTDPLTGVKLLKRSAGDKLIAIDYLNGGTNVQFRVLTWVLGGACTVSSDSAPCWGATVQTLDQNAGEGLANQNSITAANNPISSQPLVAGQFAEFGINLSKAGIIPSGSCQAFARTVWESRSSGSSFSSNPADITIEDHAVSNCGEIKIVKKTSPSGLDQKFGFTSGLNPNSGAGGLPCTSGGSGGVATGGGFCLNAATTAGSTVDETGLPAGSYDITEATEPSGFGFGGATCTGVTNGGSTFTYTAQKATVVLASGDVVTCTYTNNQLTGALKLTKVSSSLAATHLAGAKFTINDPSGTPLPGSPYTTGSDGTVCVDGLTSLGNYTVQETSAPAGYSIDDSTARTVPVSGNNAKCTDAVYLGASTTFTDTQLPGALKITKLSSKAAATPLSGAQFTIKDASGTALPGSPYTTGSDGTICVDGLTSIGSYTVQETSAPTGYGIDDSAAKTVDVTASGAKCSDSTFAGGTRTFTDTPLTDVLVSAASEVSGGTKSSITCKDSAGTNVGTSPQPSSGFADPVGVTAKGLKPGVYTCTVNIDP